MEIWHAVYIRATIWSSEIKKIKKYLELKLVPWVSFPFQSASKMSHGTKIVRAFL